MAAHLLLAPVALLAQGPVRWSGYIQARESYRDGAGLSGSINRARLSASGGGAKDVTWRVQGEFRTGSVGTGRASVSLQDAYVRYKPGAFGVQVGQFKTPFTREFITSLADIETADRSDGGRFARPQTRYRRDGGLRLRLGRDCLPRRVQRRGTEHHQ